MSKRNDFEYWQKEFFEDELLMKIFLSLRDTPKSVKQLCDESDFSPSSVYRKLKKLELKGLVDRSGTISDDGVKTFLYSRDDIYVN